MYKLLGADQKEYGPVSAEQVREWILQGRANAQTKVQPVGTTDWKALADFPEFAEALNQKAQAPMPALPGGSAVRGAPAVPAKTSALAVTSLVLGILGLCGITALFGLVCGILAMVRIEKSKGQLGGKGIALAGLITSGGFLLFLSLMAAIMLPAFAKAQQRAHVLRCRSNVRQLDMAFILYADANNGQYPARDKWCESLKPYLASGTNVFICSLGKPGQQSHYAFNARLAGVDVKSIRSPATTVLVFETEGGWDLSGGKELLPATPRHNGAYIVGFADGHCEVVRPERLGGLCWDP